MPTTTTYKLGRDAVLTLPGVDNDNVRSATISASANQLDVTTFKSVPLTSWEYMAGLIDVTLDVVCTSHTAAVEDRGLAEIAGFDSQSMDAIVLEVKESVSPKGVVEYTVTYGIIPSDVG